ncbi:MAG: hypothetical protein NTW19_09735 [Planctomycetota bacterium]|nr:hypothetical protein [Planctomycetota bacterium]
MLPRMGRAAMMLAIVGAGLLGAACQDAKWAQATPDDRVKFAVLSSRSELLAGETATFTLSSANVIGRNPRVEWSTNGGTLTTEDENRVARVKFDKPGEYLVTAKLFLADALTRTDTRGVKVKPVP